jgi:hypothetical protein
MKCGVEGSQEERGGEPHEESDREMKCDRVTFHDFEDLWEEGEGDDCKRNESCHKFNFM